MLSVSTRPPSFPGLLRCWTAEFAGAVTWDYEPDLLRIVTIASVAQGRGIGRALLAAAEAEARAAGLRRLVVSTSNSNLRALGFYQRNGYMLAALHLGAIDGFRRLKPQIPEFDPTGIRVRDMIELEKRLASGCGRRTVGMLPYLLAARAKKHVIVNGALRLLDGLVQLTVPVASQNTRTSMAQ